MVEPFYTLMHSNSNLKSFKHMHIEIGNRKRKLEIRKASWAHSPPHLLSAHSNSPALLLLPPFLPCQPA
jgi:hypothetical protein